MDVDEREVNQAVATEHQIYSGQVIHEEVETPKLDRGCFPLLPVRIDQRGHDVRTDVANAAKIDAPHPVAVAARNIQDAGDPQVPKQPRKLFDDLFCVLKIRPAAG